MCIAKKSESTSILLIILHFFVFFCLGNSSCAVDMWITVLEVYFYAIKHIVNKILKIKGTDLRRVLICGY